MEEPFEEIQILWDPQKAWANIRKHKVSFEEAETVFFDPLMTTKQDPDHSISERRFLTLGLSCNQRMLLITHTDDPGQIRIISARQPTRSERNDYQND